MPGGCGEIGESVSRPLCGYYVDRRQILPSEAVFLFAGFMKEHAILIRASLVPEVGRAVLGGAILSSAISKVSQASVTPQGMMSATLICARHSPTHPQQRYISPHPPS